MGSCHDLDLGHGGTSASSAWEQDTESQRKATETDDGRFRQ